MQNTPKAVRSRTTNMFLGTELQTGYAVGRVRAMQHNFKGFAGAMFTPCLPDSLLAGIKFLSRDGRFHFAAVV